MMDHLIKEYIKEKKIEENKKIEEKKKEELRPNIHELAVIAMKAILSEYRVFEDVGLSGKQAGYDATEALAKASYGYAKEMIKEGRRHEENT